MLLRRIHDYGKPVRIVRPGEIIVSAEDEILATLLGACVAVFLHDSVRKIGGLNHFVLTSRRNSVDRAHPESGRFGSEAIDLLLDAVLSAGAVRESVTAMIFGGTNNSSQQRTAENVRLARILLEMEDIPIIKEDVGSNHYRKVLIDIASGKIYINRISSVEIEKGGDYEKD